MNAKRFFWVLFCLMVVDAQAQSEIIFGRDDTWFSEHKMLVSEQNVRYDVIQSDHLGQNRIIIRKAGLAGVVEKSWSGGQSFGIMELNDAVLDEDNGLYLLVTVNFYEFVVLKFDENLDLLWSRVLEEIPGFFVYFKNKIMLSGDAHLFVSISNYENHLAYKLDRSGNIVWRNTYGIEFCIKCPGFDMIPLGEGALMSMKTGSSAVIYRIDGAGEVLWSKAFNDGIYRHPRAIFVVDSLIYLLCAADNMQNHMFVISQDGELLSAYFYGVGMTYYVNMYHYLDHFYFQSTQLEPGGEVLHFLVEMDYELHTLSAYLGDELYLSSTLSSMDINRSGGDLLLAKNHNISYSFPIADMANNECLNAIELGDLFSPVNDFEHILQHYSPGMVTKISLPILNIPFASFPIVSSTVLTQSTDCSDQVFLSTDAYDTVVFVYPNPAQDVLYLSAPSAFEYIRFLDLQGRVVKSIRDPSFQIDLRDLQAGNYVLQFHLKNGVFGREKMVVLR